MSDPRFLQKGFDKCLSHLIEECGELLAAAGKTQRWGAMSSNPLLPPEQQETNIAWLRREMADVRLALWRLDTEIRNKFGSPPDRDIKMFPAGTEMITAMSDPVDEMAAVLVIADVWKNIEDRNAALAYFAAIRREGTVNQYEMMARAALAHSAAQPIDMILFCPNCHTQHVDEPDERTPGWANPPHRSHLCHACGVIWRPADVPTNGVAAIKTRGKADTDTPSRSGAQTAGLVEAAYREGFAAGLQEFPPLGGWEQSKARAELAKVMP